MVIIEAIFDVAGVKGKQLLYLIVDFSFSELLTLYFPSVFNAVFHMQSLYFVKIYTKYTKVTHANLKYCKYTPDTDHYLQKTPLIKYANKCDMFQYRTQTSVIGHHSQ